MNPPAQRRFVVARHYGYFAHFCREQLWRPDRDATWLAADGSNAHRIRGMWGFELYEVDQASLRLEGELRRRGWTPGQVNRSDTDILETIGYALEEDHQRRNLPKPSEQPAPAPTARKPTLADMLRLIEEAPKPRECVLLCHPHDLAQYQAALKTNSEALARANLTIIVEASPHVPRGEALIAGPKP